MLTEDSAACSCKPLMNLFWSIGPDSFVNSMVSTAFWPIKSLASGKKIAYVKKSMKASTLAPAAAALRIT